MSIVVVLHLKTALAISCANFLIENHSFILLLLLEAPLHLDYSIDFFSSEIAEASSPTAIRFARFTSSSAFAN